MFDLGPFMNNNSTQQVMDMIRFVTSSGMSARDLFYKMAEEKGVDPDEILSKLGQVSNK